MRKDDSRKVKGFTMDENGARFTSEKIEVCIKSSIVGRPAFKLGINQLGMVLASPMEVYTLEQASMAFEDIESVCRHFGLSLSDSLVDWATHKDSSTARGTMPMPTVEFTKDSILIKPPRFHLEGFHYYLKCRIEDKEVAERANGQYQIGVQVVEEDRQAVIEDVCDVYLRYLASQDCKTISFSQVAS